MGQFEWELSNLKVSYPFERPGVDIQNEAFADALVLDTDQGLRVRVDTISIMDWDAGSINIDVAYEDGSPFFDGTPTVTVQAYGQWRVVNLYHEDKSVQFVMNGDVALPITAYGPLYFVARVQECDPDAVTSIEVEDGVTEVTHVLTGDINISAGYNILSQQLNTTYTDREGAVSVELSAIPGAGLGVAPSECDPDDTLKSINAIPAADEHGHFLLSALDCYRINIPTLGSPSPGIFDPTPATLQMFCDCGQCCTCEDYENSYKALDRIYGKGRNTGLRLARTIDDFSDLKDRIDWEKSQRNIPEMDMLLRPAPGYILGVQINLLNNTTAYDIFMNRTDMASVLVKMFVTSTDVNMSGAVVLPNSCYLYNQVYGNPWIRVDRTDLLLSPINLTSEDGVGVIIKQGIISGKLYHIIKTTQFASLFFEIYWREEVEPREGDEISVKLESELFKPYNLTKTEELLEPFEGI